MHAQHAVRYLAATLALGAPAMAQNAVGDGRALESRLQTRFPGSLPPVGRSFNQELFLREAIVSGTAPSGLSFRGEVLPSQFEFRGELGEDQLFAYRRDSLYSGLSGRGIRGTEALQYQFALSVGGRVPQTLAGPISYNRAGAAERGVDPLSPLQRDLTANDGLRRVVPEESDYFQAAVEYQAAVESGAALVAPVRSISTFTANRSLQPSLVGLMQNRRTQETSGQTSSPLLGIQVVPVDTLRNPERAPRLEAPRLPSEVLGAPGADGRGAQGAGTPAVRTAGSDRTRNPDNPQTAYDQLIARYRSLASTVDPTEPPPPEGRNPVWASELIELRRLLRGLSPSTARAMGVEPEVGPDGEVRSATRQGQNPLLDPESNPDLPTGFNVEVLQRLRDSAGVSETLIATDLAHVDAYAAHMRAGERMLERGRYFDAEERFITAMSSRRGDVNAQIGRAHAQIGAGLFLSASLNLRQLLLGNPEVAAMRFGEGLLPQPERLEQITEALRAGLGRPGGGSDSGLILAYLGWQLDRPEDIRAGLESLRDGGEAEERLAELLGAVWLGTVPSEPDAEDDDG
jgi:hypothetical protein